MFKIDEFSSPFEVLIQEAEWRGISLLVNRAEKQVATMRRSHWRGGQRAKALAACALKPEALTFQQALSSPFS
ncbi:unnamed protein product [Arctia plantaginis]|uniref:Uncharacterized protein n=1 Tax=Arctia plantaginis TaxID=874455 RepID=A0A8S1BDZ0_ARCPL|nr:unnamed protein product [Arctia plantaginis]